MQIQIPSSCPSCLETDCLSLHAGKKRMKLINKDGKPDLKVLLVKFMCKIIINTIGRFDLNEAEFHCNRCPNIFVATEEDYVASRLWPGSAFNSTYLFHEDVLEWWFYLRHECPGTSLRKALIILKRMSKSLNRVCFV